MTSLATSFSANNLKYFVNVTCTILFQNLILSFLKHLFNECSIQFWITGYIIPMTYCHLCYIHHNVNNCFYTIFMFMNSSKPYQKLKTTFFLLCLEDKDINKARKTYPHKTRAHTYIYIHYKISAGCTILEI